MSREKIDMNYSRVLFAVVILNYPNGMSASGNDSTDRSKLHQTNPNQPGNHDPREQHPDLTGELPYSPFQNPYLSGIGSPGSVFDSHLFGPQSHLTFPHSPIFDPESYLSDPQSHQTAQESHRPVPESNLSDPQSWKPVPQSRRQVTQSRRPVPDYHSYNSQHSRDVPGSSRTVTQSHQSVPQSNQSVPQSHSSVEQSPRSAPQSPRPIRQSRRTVPESHPHGQQSHDPGSNNENPDEIISYENRVLGVWKDSQKKVYKVSLLPTNINNVPTFRERINKNIPSIVVDRGDLRFLVYTDNTGNIIGAEYAPSTGISLPSELNLSRLKNPVLYNPAKPSRIFRYEDRLFGVYHDRYGNLCGVGLVPINKIPTAAEMENHKIVTLLVHHEGLIFDLFIDQYGKIWGASLASLI